MRRIKTYTPFIICVVLGSALGSIARVHLFANAFSAFWLGLMAGEKPAPLKRPC